MAMKNTMVWLAAFALCSTVLGEDLISRTFCSTYQGQVYCSSGFKREYPLDKIEAFIDQNKALVERLYGGLSSDYQFSGGFRRKRESILK